MVSSPSNPRYDAVASTYAAQSFSPQIIPQDGKPQTLAMLAGYANDEKGFFESFNIFIKTIILMTFFGIYTFFFIIYCNKNGCFLRVILINLLIFAICFYLLYKLFGN